MENQNQTPQNQPTKLHQRQFKPFWPIVIICSLSFLVGGLLVWALYNQGLDDQIYSLLPGKLVIHKTNELRRVSLPGGEGKGEGGDVSNWQTYVNREYGFEFRYPSQLFVVNLADGSNLTADIRVNYITKIQNALRGMSYCESAINDSVRCEAHDQFIVDWQNNVASANLTNGATVNLQFKNSDTLNKDLVKQILSTFKFSKSVQ